jgi:hypothetical protein
MHCCLLDNALLTFINITSKTSLGANHFRSSPEFSGVSETPEVPELPDTPVIPAQLEVPDNQQTSEVADWPASQ